MDAVGLASSVISFIAIVSKVSQWTNSLQATATLDAIQDPVFQQLSGHLDELSWLRESQRAEGASTSSDSELQKEAIELLRDEVIDISSYFEAIYALLPSKLQVIMPWTAWKLHVRRKRIIIRLGKLGLTLNNLLSKIDTRYANPG